MLTFLFSLLLVQVFCDNYVSINLPEEHLPYYFTKFPTETEKCQRDESCLYKKYLNTNSCWGYEPNCTWDRQYLIPSCPGDHKGWVKTKYDQQNTFFTQGDFGYVKEQLKEMKVYCAPLFAHDSSLECTDHLRFCRGRNIMINFSNLESREDPIRYAMDVLSQGDIGGYCDFDEDKLLEQADHISPLQSWGPELRYFTRLRHRPIIEGDCNVVIDKPTFIMKIDATVNMYHHFCDFVNLYASLHVNASHPTAFSTNVHILIWETYTYHSAFQDTWKAFTDHSLWDLKTFRGKTVCFKNAVFPLLPRMIFGLYYNTPIIYGCERSGLFDAFSKHILHRLKIPLHQRQNSKIRITLLSRDTKYRRILNEHELLEAIKDNSNYQVRRVVYNKNIPFKEQLEISRNTDILIGIHGAGLTHVLFLPEWAVLFELYNCEDANCYLDLARLKGAKYITWEDSEKLSSEYDGTHKGGAHAKFANYQFDPTEFVRLTSKAATHVINHPKFKKFVGSHSKDKTVHEEL